MKKILLINPWAINNDGNYARGFIDGMQRKAEITFVTNCHFEGSSLENVTYKKIFFCKSEKMRNKFLRKIFRGVEYVCAYLKILSYLRKENYDVVHIHWLLLYNLDVAFLKMIKRCVPQLVLTAHNVLPHTNSEKYLTVHKKIYDIVDDIIVHGESIKKEFVNYFPEFESKLKIQYHGTYFNQKTNYDEQNVPEEIKNTLFAYKKIFLMIGVQFYNKGTDRIVSIWLKNHQKTKDALLVIAGKRRGAYPQMDALVEEISKCNNIMYLNYFIDDNVANYLLNKCDCIMLPYRHASMSGVVFTAAEFGKTVASTDTGAISEYIENSVDGFLCDNSDEAYEKCLLDLLENYDEEKLHIMGLRLQKNIKDKYDWKNIGDSLIEEIYK